MLRPIDLRSAAAFFLVLALAAPAHSQGWGRQFLEFVGRTTGAQSIGALGRSLDEQNRLIKENVDIYKRFDEGVSAIAQRPFIQACTANFDTVAAAVHVGCSGFSAQSSSSSDAALIESAKRRLVSLGIVSRADFDGVSIRWCNGRLNARGITPNKDEIILSADLKSDRKEIETTLAHEMRHVFQYRSMGTDAFKCEYSKHFLGCGGCQDSGHQLEAEAYAFQAMAATTITAATSAANGSLESPGYTPNCVLSGIGGDNGTYRSTWNGDQVLRPRGYYGANGSFVSFSMNNTAWPVAAWGVNKYWSVRSRAGGTLSGTGGNGATYTESWSGAKSLTPRSYYEVNGRPFVTFSLNGQPWPSQEWGVDQSSWSFQCR